MAKSGLKHIDVGAELTKTEWESEDSHELLHGSSFPGTPVERQLFYRDDEHKWYIYTGAAWTELTGGGSGMSVHGNEYHDPDFEQQGVAAALVGLHSTLDTHTLDQPAAEHGNEKHNPDFADATHTHSDLSPAHKDVATAVHGVGGSTIESVSGSQAKVDAHKDLATGAHGVGSNHIAQAPAAAHLVRTFTKGWTSGKVLRGAGVAADPTELSSWTKIADITVAGSPVTYIDINSLGSDLDKFYVLFCNLKNHGAADRSCVLSVNADYTEAHYYCQVIDASGAVLTAARYNSSYMGGIPASGSLAVMAYLLKDPHGYFRYYTFTTRLLSTVCIQNWAGVKSDATIAKITSLRIWMADANIGVGTNVILAKPLTD